MHGPHDCSGHMSCSVHDFVTVVAMCTVPSMTSFITVVATYLVLSMRTSLLSSGHMSCSLHEDFIYE